MQTSFIHSRSTLHTTVHTNIPCTITRQMRLTCRAFRMAILEVENEMQFTYSGVLISNNSPNSGVLISNNSPNSGVLISNNSPTVVSSFQTIHLTVVSSFQTIHLQWCPHFKQFTYSGVLISSNSPTVVSSFQGFIYTEKVRLGLF